MSEKQIRSFPINVGGLVDETGVCIALYGPELDPDEITRQLGCPPTHAHRRGDRRKSDGPPYQDGAWLLEVRGTAPVSPDELLRQLVQALPGDPSTWDFLAAKYRVQVRVGVHFSGWNKGFCVSNEVVAIVALFRASLEFDLYGYGEDAEA